MTQTFTAGQTLTAAAVNQDLAFPTGTILAYAGATAPTQDASAEPYPWLLCDGTAVSRSTYATLFALLSTTYGTGDGSTTFDLPDLRGRIPLGAGTGVGLGSSGAAGTPPAGTSLTARALGSWGGDERMPQHNHGGATGNDSPDHSHTTWSGFWIKTGGGAVGNSSGAWIDIASAANVGGATARHTHSISNDGAGNGGNMPPYVVLNYIIKT